MKTAIVLLLCCAWASFAFGQGACIPPNLALQTINGTTRPLANATITVCAANTSGIPCSPALPSGLYKDPALTQSLSNPFTADANGNYNFCAAPAQYTVTISASGYSGYSYQVSGPGGSAAGTFTNTGLSQFAPYLLNGISPSSLIAGLSFTDALAGGILIPSSTTNHQDNALAGYIDNHCAGVAGNKCNGVALYGVAQASVSGSAVWGANPGASDAVGTSGTNIVGEETDINIMGTPGVVFGYHLNGSGTGVIPSAFAIGSTGSSPAGAAAYTVFSPYGAQGNTSLWRWPVGFAFARGALASGSAGLQMDGTCLPSQVPCSSPSVSMTGYDGGNVAHTGKIAVDQNGNILIVPDSGKSVMGNNIPIATSFTTTAATTDNVTVTGMTASGHCSLFPTNSGAAGGIASVYVSNKTTNQITVTHTATAGWTFDVLCTPN